VPTSIPLGQLEKVDIRDVWSNEANDFTPWLAEDANVQLLGNTIGYELEVEATEKDVGPFRADILCKDTATGHWVLIENQLERTDHIHLGQLITYAAGLKAATIVWIASRFTDEHRAAIDWLNEITNGEFNFFGLEVEVWRIGQSATAPKFNIVCAPNNWSQTVSQAKKNVEQTEISGTKQLQLEFWTSFRDYVLDRKTIIKPTKPFPQNWMNISIGKSGFTLVPIVSTYDLDDPNSDGQILRVEFVMQDDSDKSCITRLESMKPQIEAEYGGPINWSPSIGKKQSKVFVKKAVDLEDRNQWPTYHAWMLENLEKFHVIFAKRLKLLSASASEMPVGE
jgi:hypothetical protein